MSERTITFAEWGEQWMDLVMTPLLIEHNLRRMIKPTVDIQFPGVTGTGTVQIGEVSRTNRGDGTSEIVFQAPLQVALQLSINVLGLYSETYVATAITQLSLVLKALPMLKLRIDCPAVRAEDIVAESDSEHLMQLIQQFADVNHQLRRYIAAEINQQIAATEDQRTISILDRIKDATELLKI